VISTGQAELVPEITEEMIAAIDDPEVTAWFASCSSVR
jgi:hypothetical protein